MRCPMRWYLRYVEKVPRTNSAAVRVGSGIHAGLAAHWRGEDVRAAAERGASGDEEPDGILSALAVIVVEEALPEVVNLAGEVALVEHPFLAVELDSDTLFEGTIDLVTRAGEIIDYKTGENHKPAGWADRSLQLGLYAYAMDAEVCHAISISTRVKPAERVKAQTTIVTPERKEQAIETALAVVRGMREGVPTPNTESWECSQVYCGVWFSCPYGGKERTATNG